MHPLKTLVLGGYGNFGARTARSLARERALQVVVAGRDAERANRFAGELGGTVSALQVDAGNPGLADILRAQGIGLVIHTAGPFQAQGYEVARACAEAGCHYIDLADGRRFVCDFPAALDEPFMRAGRTAISGASTVPALSSAVVGHLTAGWREIHTIDICIAPAQTAPRGAATIAGVLSTCGAPVPVWREGAWQQEHAWERLRRVAFARLHPRLGALCDVPDLTLFPALYQVRDAVRVEAALEVPLSQRAFSWMATARRRGWLSRPERWANALNALAPLLDPWGSALGGMVVRTSGLDAQGQSSRRAWHVTADQGHGPEIPTMPAVLLARRFARQHTLPRGAHTAAGLLPLSAFANEFQRWGMLTDEE